MIRVMRLLKPLFIAAGALTISVFVSACGDNSTDGDALTGDALTGDAAIGKTIAEENCMGCHTVDGKPSSGPTWKGLSGSQVKLADGRVVTADDAFLTRSIEDPDADIVAQYPKTMSIPVPKGSIAPDEVRALVAYINTLR